MNCALSDVNVPDSRDGPTSAENYQTAMADIKGIFIRGFDRDLTHKHLKGFFQEFGEIEDVILNKRQMFAIIEFRERKPVDLVLSREIFLQGKRLKISLRKSRPSSYIKISPEANGPPDSLNQKTEAEPDRETWAEVLSANVTVNNFEMQVSRFVKKTEATNIEKKVEQLCQSLLNSLFQTFPNCIIYPFGSSVTGLASNESDVDIYIDTGKIESSDKNKKSSSGLVMTAKRILLRNCEFTRCIGIPKARVPILKCFFKSSCLNCDINFQNALGIYNSQLIKYYLSFEPRLRILTMFIKYWAKVNNLIGPGNLTSYALVMIFLFYTQQLPNPVLPTVAVLQERCATVNIVQRWPCHFDRTPKDCEKYTNKDSMIKLLGGFFSFCANFDFEKNVLIMNSASVVPRHHFTNCTPENSVCHSYKLSLAKFNAGPIALNKVMCVLDPFALNHNITAAVGLREMNKFQIRCYKSAEVCKRIANNERGLCLQSIFDLHGKPKKVKFPYLEYWKENDVKLIIPLKSFDPENLFDSSTVALTNPTRTSWIELLVSHLKEIFEKVLSFSLIKEEVGGDQRNSGKQVIKIEGMEDVHARGTLKVIHSVTLHLSSSYHVWNGRGNAYKEFSFPKKMKLMEKEMHVTNYIIDTFYKRKAKTLHRVDLKCVLVPIMDSQGLEMCITLCNSSDTFKPLITFLLSLLHRWLNK